MEKRPWARKKNEIASLSDEQLLKLFRTKYGFYTRDYLKRHQRGIWEAMKDRGLMWAVESKTQKSQDAVMSEMVLKYQGKTTRGAMENKDYERLRNRGLLGYFKLGIKTSEESWKEYETNHKGKSGAQLKKTPEGKRLLQRLDRQGLSQYLPIERNRR